MKPEVEQKTVEQHAPRIVRRNIFFNFYVFFAICVSPMAVKIGSNSETAESIPRVNKVRERIIDHPFGYGRVSMAVGSAIYARLIDFVFAATGESIPLR